MQMVRIVAAMVLGGLSSGALAGPGDHEGGRGAVYTTTNQADNKLVVFPRLPGGQLGAPQEVETGGQGTDMGLGSQGAIAATFGGQFLYCVNAGDSTISAFRVGHSGPSLLGVVGSGGQHPVSLTIFGRVLYVLNAGGEVGDSDNITGFRIAQGGTLVPIPGSTQALSGPDTMPAEIGFSRSGHVLVVTEKATSKIDTFIVGPGWVAGNLQSFDSPTPTPFGFAFDNRNHLIVSQAAGGDPDASTVTSFSLSHSGVLSVLHGPVPTTETAACWVVLPASGRFAFTTNTGSGTVTGLRLSPSGALNLLQPDGQSADLGADSMPIDADIVGNKYLYVLEAGDGVVSGWRIEPHTGRLVSIGARGDLPDSAAGLIAF